MRSLWDRYEVIYDGPSLMAEIQWAEATIYTVKSSQLHPWWLSTNDNQSSIHSSNNDHWCAGHAKLFTRNWGTFSATTLECMISMTGYCDAYKLDSLMQLPMVMAMAMAMISRERKPPLMLPTQDKAPTMIVDFTEITVCNSDNVRHLVQVTSGRLDGQMPGFLEVEIWRSVSLWMFLLSLFFSSVYFFTLLLLWISAQTNWQWHRFLPPQEINKVEVEVPCALKLPNGYLTVLIGSVMYGFIQLSKLNGCLIVSISTLAWVYTAQEVST